MRVEDLHKNFVKICGSKFVSDDPEVLESYSKDLSFVEGKVPSFIIWPRKAKQVEKILKLANSLGFSVIPISSSSPIHYYGDTLPQKSNTVIVNLSKMNKIIKAWLHTIIN